ncbi:MAG: hypothetical protein ACI8RA_001648, partial [Chlamydiales bacterium]
ELLVGRQGNRIIIISLPSRDSKLRDSEKISQI